MPVSDEKKFIYIHIPKCAGSSITDAIRSCNVHLDFKGRIPEEDRAKHGIAERWLHHLSAATLQRFVPVEKWAGYFKFAFVRNPWDLVVSYYFYHGRRIGESAEFRNNHPDIVALYDRVHSFDEWVKAGIYVPLSSSFVVDAQRAPCMDFIGKCENLEDDFVTVCDRIGIQTAIPHRNKTEHGPYREYYTQASRELVRQAFEADIRMFNYAF